MSPDTLPEPLRIALGFTALLDRLGIRYVLAGSLASSMHGDYVSREAAAEAVRNGASFNAIHLDSALKVDVFVAGSDAFDQERISQGGVTSVEGHTLRVDRAEFSVLRKLEWYRRGGEVSERQWRDAQAILKVQGSRLDQSVLTQWAARIGVTDLLERALRPAESP